jgi:hypothetical protein
MNQLFRCSNEQMLSVHLVPLCTNQTNALECFAQISTVFVGILHNCLSHGTVTSRTLCG